MPYRSDIVSHEYRVREDWKIIFELVGGGSCAD